MEGELGFGKPDHRVYHLALDRLQLAPSEVWMVGDNLEWDVASPQELGIYSVWVDVRGGWLTRGVDDSTGSDRQVYLRDALYVAAVVLNTASTCAASAFNDS